MARALKPLQYLRLVLNTSSEDNDFGSLPFPNILKQSCNHGHNKGKINSTANREEQLQFEKRNVTLATAMRTLFFKEHFRLPGPSYSQEINRYMNVVFLISQ